MPEVGGGRDVNARPLAAPAYALSAVLIRPNVTGARAELGASGSFRVFRLTGDASGVSCRSLAAVYGRKSAATAGPVPAAVYGRKAALFSSPVDAPRGCDENRVTR